MDLLQVIKTYGINYLETNLPVSVIYSKDYRLANCNYITEKAYSQEWLDNPIVRQCRGTLIDLDTMSYVARGFDRFYEYGQYDNDPFDTSEFTVYPKLDGTLVLLYWDNASQEWEIKTRGTIVADVVYRNMFWTYYHDTSIEVLFKDYTYIFELTSPKTPIVVRYPSTKVTLLAARHNESGEYVDIHTDRMINIVLEGNIIQPLCYSDGGCSLEDILNNAIKLNGFEAEGYVLVDKNNNRLKIKADSYKKLHKKLPPFKPLIASNILEMIYLSDKEEDVEIVNSLLTNEEVYSDVNWHVAEITNIYLALDYVVEGNASLSQKEFAAYINSHKNELVQKYKPIIFRLRKEGTTPSTIPAIAKIYIKLLRSKRE